MNPLHQVSYLGDTWPERYDHPLREYEALRRSWGWMPMPLAVLAVAGSDAAGFLQGLGTLDFLRMGPGASRECLFLDASGKILFMARAMRLADRFLLLLPGKDLDPLGKHLGTYLIMEQVTLRMEPLACFTVQGPQAEGIVNNLHTSLAVRSAHDRCGLGGFDLLLPRENVGELTRELAALGPPFGLTALDLLRTEAFLPWFGMEIQRGQNPMIYGSGGRISHDKGCYLGQETIAMTRDRGRPPRLLTHISAHFDGLPQAEAELLSGDGVVGQILSGHFSPFLEKPVAFALVKTSHALPGGELRDRQNQLWTIDRVASLRDPS